MRNDIFLKEMGAKIRAMRKKNDMSLQSLADAIRMNISNLSFIETGKTNPHLLTLLSIPDILEVDVKDLL